MNNNFRVVRVCIYSPNKIEQLYVENNLDAMTFDEQLARYQQENFIMPGSWSSAMNQLGNECIDLLLNARLMQERWCRENGITVNFADKNWMYQVLCAYLRIYNPDVLFFYSGVFTWFSKQQRAELRKKCRDLKLITGLWGDELTQYANYKRAFSDVDLIFTNTEKTRGEIREAGIVAEVLGNCFDDVIARQEFIPSEEVEESYHTVFLGSTGFGCDLHRGRYLKILGMMQQTDMKIWTEEPDQKKKKKRKSMVENIIRTPFRKSIMGGLNSVPTPHLASLKMTRFTSWKFSKYIDEVIARREGLPIRGEFFQGREKISSLFPQRCSGNLDSWLDFLEVMKRSKYVFNAHRDEVSDYSNIRVFEATGVGSCLISDRGAEMKNFFEPDSEIVTFDSVDEAVEKIEYLDNHEEVRREIAIAGQKRTLRDHTVYKRCEKIHEVVSKLI